jgi:paraquat-inducible protein B
MSKQANTKAIGAFVLAGLALAVTAIVMFGSGKFFVKKTDFVAFFQGTVQGLKVGAPVVFRGVRVGQVTKIQIFEDPQVQIFEIPVIMEIESENFQQIAGGAKEMRTHIQDLIKIGLRAQLGLQSIVTGQMMVSIDLHPGTPVRFVGAIKERIAKNLTEIPTIPSTIQKIENTGAEVIKSLHYFKQVMREMRDMAAQVNQRLDPLLVDADQTLKDAQQLIRNIHTQVEPLAMSFKQTSDAAGATFKDASKLIKDVDRQVEPLADNLQKTLVAAQGSLKMAEATLTTVNAAAAEGSTLRFEVNNTLDELARAARALRTLANFLERNPDALLRGKADVGGK